MSVSIVVRNGATSTGEGPHWEEATQSLLYVDQENGDVHRWNSQTGEDQKLHLGKNGQCVTFIVPCSTDGYIVSIGKTIYHLDWQSETVTKLAAIDGELKTKFNDGKCDDNGRLWAGTVDEDFYLGKPLTGMGTLCALDNGHTLKKHLDNINLTNGMTWSHDNRTMYYIDSLPGNLFALDFDLTEGTINTATQRTVLDFSQCKTHTLGLPDGMTIDTEGKLWVACYDAGKVVRLDPNTGVVLREVHIPTKKTTSCCFGGKNLDELYVTSAKNYLTEEEFQSERCIAGSVFKVTGLGVKGTPANVFGGVLTKN